MHVQKTPQSMLRLALDMGDLVPVINRTAKPLEVQVDGRIYIMQPGLNRLPAVAVPYAIRQHPRMGTFDTTGLDGESLIGVQGHSRIDPIAPGTEVLGNEQFDRTKAPMRLPEGAKSEKDVIVIGMPSPRQVIGGTDRESFHSLADERLGSIELSNDNTNLG